MIRPETDPVTRRLFPHERAAAEAPAPAAATGAAAAVPVAVDDGQAVTAPFRAPAQGLTTVFQPPEPLGTIGGYELVQRLGQRTFLGLHRESGDPAVIQVYPAAPPRTRQLLEHGRALARVASGNVARVLEVSHDAGCVYVATEHLRGATLESVLDLHGSLSIAQVLRAGMLIARGLEAAHRCGVVHGNLDARAALVVPSERGRSTIKLVGFELGPPGEVALIARHSMSPEQCRGEPVDQRADLYSLGVLLYRAATGRQPFEGTPIDILEMYRFRSMVRPPPAVTGVPEALATLIQRCLSVDPAERPQTAAELFTALRAVATHAAVGGAADVALDGGGSLDELAPSQPALAPSQPALAPSPALRATGTAPPPIARAAPWAALGSVAPGPAPRPLGSGTPQWPPRVAPAPGGGPPGPTVLVAPGPTVLVAPAPAGDAMPAMPSLARSSVAAMPRPPRGARDTSGVLLLPGAGSQPGAGSPPSAAGRLPIAPPLGGGAIAPPVEIPRTRSEVRPGARALMIWRAGVAWARGRLGRLWGAPLAVLAGAMSIGVAASIWTSGGAAPHAAAPLGSSAPIADRPPVVTPIAEPTVAPVAMPPPQPAPVPAAAPPAPAIEAAAPAAPKRDPRAAARRARERAKALAREQGIEEERAPERARVDSEDIDLDRDAAAPGRPRARPAARDDEEPASEPQDPDAEAPARGRGRARAVEADADAEAPARGARDRDRAPPGRSSEREERSEREARDDRRRDAELDDEDVGVSTDGER